MQKLDLTIVIASKNCEERILQTIVPWKDLAQEIIVVDQMSTDQSAKIAQAQGCKVIQNIPDHLNFNLNRKLGMQQAKTQWLLYIDTDERPTPEMLKELTSFLNDAESKKYDGVRIPNYFYFLGKPLKYGLYNKRSAEIRLMRQNFWVYDTEHTVHGGVTVKGKVKTFTHGYKHFNVNTLAEWFIKTNQYTEHDSLEILKNHKSPIKVYQYKAFYEAFRFFIRHYFIKKGFLDGFHGLVSVFYFMLYHLTLKIKIWEKTELSKLTIEQDYIESIKITER